MGKAQKDSGFCVSPLWAEAFEDVGLDLSSEVEATQNSIRESEIKKRQELERQRLTKLVEKACEMFRYSKNTITQIYRNLFVCSDEEVKKFFLNGYVRNPLENAAELENAYLRAFGESDQPSKVDFCKFMADSTRVKRAEIKSYFSKIYSPEKTLIQKQAQKSDAWNQVINLAGETYREREEEEADRKYDLACEECDKAREKLQPHLRSAAQITNQQELSAGI